MCCTFVCVCVVVAVVVVLAIESYFTKATLFSLSLSLVLSLASLLLVTFIGPKAESLLVVVVVVGGFGKILSKLMRDFFPVFKMNFQLHQWHQWHNNSTQLARSDQAKQT